MKNQHEFDTIMVRHTFGLARQAKEAGNFPFACILTNASGEILLEAQNSIHTDKNNLCHAEMSLLYEANRRYEFEHLQHYTVYANAEPCPMCAAAIFWSGIGRVVYGLSNDKKNRMTKSSRSIQMNIPCRQILESGNRMIDVVGPLLENEAEQIYNA